MRFRPSTKISFWFTSQGPSLQQVDTHLDALAQVTFVEGVAYPSGTHLAAGPCKGCKIDLRILIPPKTSPKLGPKPLNSYEFFSLWPRGSIK